MRSFTTVVVLVICATVTIVSCGGKSDGDGGSGGGAPSASAPPAADTTPPRVASSDPVDLATNISVNTTTVVTFSEPMDEVTVIANTTNTTCSGAIQVSDDNFTSCIRFTAQPTVSNGNRTFTVQPSSSLLSSTIYKIKITTMVKDAVGNAIAAEYVMPNGFTTQP